MTGRYLALTLLVCALWASVGIAIKITLADAPPLGLAAVRMMLAAGMLWLWMRLRSAVVWDWTHARVMLIATAFYSLLLAFTHLGFDKTSAARGIVLLNTTPLFVALFASVMAPRERIGIVKAAGLAIAFAGVVTIFAHRFDAAGSILGDVILILAAISWGGHTLWIKRAARDADPALLNLVQFVGAGAVAGMISLATEPFALWRPSVSLALGTVYLAAAGTVLVWLLWVHILRRVPATTASAYIFVTPLFGVVMGWLILGEPITIQFVLGALLVSAGIVVVTRAGSGG